MIHLPNMLLIGSADRNIGKTELACSILGPLAPQTDVTGLKVTTIRERGSACPRGGEGCGVCSALEGEYLLTDETEGDPTKDTGRLSAAGARPVYWLRALADSLEPGIRAALARMPAHAPVICESNSLRQVVEPGLFLMVTRPNAGPAKASAAAVWDLADRIVEVRRDGPAAHLDGLDLADLSVQHGGWALAEEAAAIVLAGGESRRMGRDKAYLPVGGRPLIEHVCDQLRPHVRHLLISASSPDGYDFLGAPVIVDPVPGDGPLRGVATALAASAHDTNLVVACDIPTVDATLVRHLLRLDPDCDCVVPRTASGHLEPLFAVYRKSALGALERALRSGERSLCCALDRCHTRCVDLEPGREPINLNTAEAYEQFLGQAGPDGGGSAATVADGCAVGARRGSS